MLKIPNYNVVVPVVPDLRLRTRRRVDRRGSRGERSFRFRANESTFVRLPWIPVAAEWVEVYIDGVRLINPRITSAVGGSLFEVYNIEDNNGIRFNQPVTGDLLIICDTKATPWYGALIIDPTNVQARYEYKTLNDFLFTKWPIIGGSVNDLTYRIIYEAGPDFATNSYVTITNCTPSNFNGNFQVVSSTADTLIFRGNVASPSDSVMKIPGTITGFGNGIVKTVTGIGLYSEPIIITQPVNGYARLTADRQRIAYIPDMNYVGNDVFSWSMINQHGQIGVPKCVNITVTAT